MHQKAVKLMPKGSKTHAKRQQNSCQKAAKIMAKGSKTHAKRLKN